MPISFTCACSKKLRVRDELAGKTVRCPGCGKSVRVGGQETKARRSAVQEKASRAVSVKPGFPILGYVIAGATILTGCLLIVGAIALTIAINRQGQDFKPAGLIVIGMPGVLWILFGGLLLGLKQRFVIPFAIFLIANLLLGVLFTTQPRSMGFARGDATIFAWIGLGFILGAVLFQLFHGFLVRDVRRQTAAAKKEPS